MYLSNIICKIDYMKRKEDSCKIY